MALSKPREAALKTLVCVQKDGAYLNIALRDFLYSSDMDERDRALATAISFGVTKNRLYIDNIIENLSTVKIRKMSVWIHNILRIGVYSLKFLDRIPVSATVNECVRLSRRYGHRASAGFVNALLRAAASAGDFLPEKGSAEYISTKYSFPLWLVHKWQSEGYGEELFASMNEEPPVTVRLNTLKGDSLPSSLFEKIPNEPFSYIYIGGGSIENTDWFKSGTVTVQDLASQKAILDFSPKENMQVLDLCASPGGKSAFMAQLMKNSGELVSCDIHSHKLPLTAKNFERLGVSNAKLLKNDASIFNGSFKDRFDRVLADVPCSGLGVLRRKPDIKWTKDPFLNESLTAVQEKILENAAHYTKKGGRLMYSTCTLNKAENEDNVMRFLKKHNDFALVLSRTLLPHTDGTDGFYYAVLERTKQCESR